MPSGGTPVPARASTNPEISHAVVNRAAGSTTDGIPNVHRMSTVVAAPSIGMRGRGDHSSVTQAATAHSIDAHAAGPSTFARPQPSRAPRSVVAAAIGSRATAASASIGDSQRFNAVGCGGAAGGGGVRGGPVRDMGCTGSAVVSGSALFTVLSAVVAPASAGRSACRPWPAGRAPGTPCPGSRRLPSPGG